MNNKLNIQTKHKKMEKVRIRNRNILTKEVVTVGALGKKGFFEDPQSVTSQSRIKYDEMPFIITGERVYDCHHRHALTVTVFNALGRTAFAATKMATEYLAVSHYNL